MRYIIVFFFYVIAQSANAVTEPTVNDCTLAGATDRTGQSTVTISFGGSFGLTYSPACLHVDPGTQVTFNGLFASHSLRGGMVIGGVEMDDFSSPIPSQDTGTMRTVTINRQGLFGYYCLAHGSSNGMYGAILVGAEQVFVDGFGE